MVGWYTMASESKVLHRRHESWAEVRVASMPIARSSFSASVFSCITASATHWMGGACGFKRNGAGVVATAAMMTAIVERGA